MRIKRFECTLSSATKIQALLDCLTNHSQCTEEVVVQSAVKLSEVKEMVHDFLEKNTHVKTLDIGLGMKQVSM